VTVELPRSVLVANRGEIALRIGRTLRRLGIETVAVYTPDDAGSPHVAAADRALRIGSYLEVDQVVDAARRAGAAALHPGYGFLAENAVLARACDAAGVVFVGPPAAAIELMGDKINAKRAVAAAGVPVVPGRDEAGLDDDALAAAAVDVGLPVLLKPSAGGGGKGMRRVDDESQLRQAIAAARREALGAFGDDTLLVERFVRRARHVEVQVFADAHGTTVALGERECTLQRRHQKIVEEAPSPLLSARLRSRVGASAVECARACGYVGAGTVEFVVSGDAPDDYFFMEMNTRLQVEHPVTEMLLGVDLVEWQLLVASGGRIPAAAPSPSGHAVEARLYAEDPARGFLPASGRVLAVSQPAGEGVRVDSALAEGVFVGTGYDPMVAKVVAWGEDRAAALARLRLALGSTHVLGFATNTGFLRRLLAHPDVEAGDLDTGLVEREAAGLLGDPAPAQVVAAAALLARSPGGGDPAPRGPRPGGPWELADGWRPGGAAPLRRAWRVGGSQVQVAAGDGWCEVDGRRMEVRLLSAEGHWALVEVDGEARRYLFASDGDGVWLGWGGDTWRLSPETASAGRRAGPAAGDGRVASPMPGRVLAVHVGIGTAVAAGQAIATVEAMKMEHVVGAPFEGVVAEVSVRPGDPVSLDQVLARVEPAAAVAAGPAA
jgi:acetyl-CoA/propionyl-CoA carboxylase biotin carboxyl carrier protein